MTCSPLYVNIPDMDNLENITLNTQDVITIFECSRPTAYNIMAGHSFTVQMNRTHRVTDAQAMTDRLNTKEAELLARLEEEVYAPRRRLVELLSKKERPQESTYHTF